MYPSFVIPDCCPLTALCTLLFWSLLAESMWSMVRNSGLNEIVDLQLLALCSASGRAFLPTCKVCQLLQSLRRSKPDSTSTIQYCLCLYHSQRITTIFLLCRGWETVCSWPVFPVDSEMSRASWRWRKEECCCLTYPVLRLAEQQVPGNGNVKARPKMLFVKAREVLTTLRLLSVLWEVWLSGELANAVSAWMSEVEICKITSCSFCSLTEAGKVRITWGPVLPAPNSKTGHWALFQCYLQPVLLCLSLSISPLSFSFPPSLSNSLLTPSIPHSPSLLLCPLSSLFPPLLLTLCFSSLPSLSPPCLLSLPSFPCACSLPYHRYYC